MHSLVLYATEFVSYIRVDPLRRRSMSKPRVDRPFVGIPTFLRAPLCTDLDQLNAAIAVMGVPFDEGSPYLAGSRMGPRALREHSLRFVGGGSKGYYDPEAGRQFLEFEMGNGLI